MKVYDEAMYWKSNREWYRSNYEEKHYELTPKAPPKAVESFRLYLLRNDIPITDSIPSKRVCENFSVKDIS